MKNELVYHRRYKTREQAIREITEYIEEAWIPIPLLPIGDSLLCGKVQHEKYFVSTIEIRGHCFPPSCLKLFNVFIKN